jgi:hypothetical protein
LKALLTAPDQVVTRATWRDWFNRSFIINLERNKDQFEANVCTLQKLREDHQQKSDDSTPPNDSTQARPTRNDNFRQHFQRLAYD